jgi:hypothetical protein
MAQVCCTCKQAAGQHTHVQLTLSACGMQQYSQGNLMPQQLAADCGNSLGGTIHRRLQFL